MIFANADRLMPAELMNNALRQTDLSLPCH